MKKILIIFCLLLLNACDIQTEKKELNNMLEKYSSSSDSKTQEKASLATEKIREMKKIEVNDIFVSRIMEVASLRDELLAGEIK